jgi:hypothetical protein
VRLPGDWGRFQRGVIRCLAEEIEQEGGHRLMPVLADALEDAGCTDAAVLGHARQAEPHPPGCWLLDLLLGRD